MDEIKEYCVICEQACCGDGVPGVAECKPGDAVSRGAETNSARQASEPMTEPNLASWSKPAP